MNNQIKDSEHQLIWQKVENLEQFLTNHIVTRLDKLNGRQWKLMFSLIGILGSLSLALILALVK